MGRDLDVRDSHRPSQSAPGLSTRERSNEGSALRVPRDSGTALPWQANATTWQFSSVGPSAEELLGYPPAEWYEPGFWISHVHPEDQDQAACLRRNSVAGSTAFAFEYRMVSASGKTVWIYDTGWVEQPDDSEQYDE